MRTHAGNSALPAFQKVDAAGFPAHTGRVLNMGFIMSCLERAITDGHAKLTGEVEHARLGRRRLRRAAGRLRAMLSRVAATPRRRRWTRRPRRATNQAHRLDWRVAAATGRRSYAQCGVLEREANNDLQPGTVAQASAPAGGGSVPLPVCNWATTRGETPLEPTAGTAALRSNDIQSGSKGALIAAIKKCHQTLWAGCKLSPPAAFGELCKIIFVKISDEHAKRKKGEPYEFQIKTHESNQLSLLYAA